MKTKFTIKYINEIHNCLNQIIKQENKLIKLSNCYKKLKKITKLLHLEMVVALHPQFTLATILRKL